MIIAMDGPAASGKGTLARQLASHYGLGHLDTGALYRAVARDMLASGKQLDDEEAAAQTARNIDPGSLEDPGLRTARMGEAASLVAKLPRVRKALVEYQRAFANRPGGVVIEGRDIGTVVCPGADVKIFIEASTQVRAKRRHEELIEAGQDITYEEIHAQIAARDTLDRSRAISPLVPAEDAHLLDTSDLGIEAALQAAVKLIDSVIR